MAETTDFNPQLRPDAAERLSARSLRAFDGRQTRAFHLRRAAARVAAQAAGTARRTGRPGAMPIDKTKFDARLQELDRLIAEQETRERRRA